VGHALANARGEIEGDFSLSDFDQDRVAAASPGIRTLTVDGGFLVLDPVERIRTVHIFGAGHVAQPTAQLANLVGFRVWVADDREGYANCERFPDAYEIRVLDSFEKSMPDVALDQNDYLIILTRGHLHDKKVLAQALRTRAGYIGMIGSHKKRNAIYGVLLKEGFTQADIDRVHSPIGLSIGAETPEEIAVSIVAELIAVSAKTKT
jgi:xanthine dehydrogenase accessory factor